MSFSFNAFSQSLIINHPLNTSSCIFCENSEPIIDLLMELFFILELSLRLQVGVYIIVRAYLLDYTIKYDQQNRVYVVPGKRHVLSGVYSGLCGDFNGKTEDDFRRLDNAMADNAMQFGKSWADSSSACELTVKDTCQQNPDREAWAQKGR